MDTSTEYKLGGSMAGGICGVSKWENQLSIWLRLKGFVPAKEDNEAMFWGRELEEKVAKVFQERAGLDVYVQEKELVSADYPFITAHIDRWCDGRKAVLECKTSSEYRRAEWEVGVPDDYMCQLQHYLYVTGCQVGYVATLCGGNKFYYYKVERNETLIKEIVDAEIKFHELLITNEMPAVDGSEISHDAITKAFPEASGEVVVDLGSYLEGRLMQREILKAKMDELEEEVTEIDNLIKVQLGESKFGNAGSYKVSWNQFVTNRLDTTKIKKENAELCQKYITTTSSRRLDIKKIKAGE